MLQKIKSIKTSLLTYHTGLMEKISPAVHFFYCMALGVSLLFCPIFLFFWIPTAGVAIGALGAAGVFVAIRGEFSKRGEKVRDGEKVVWAFITFVFLVTEVRAIYKDRADVDRKQTETVKEIVNNATGGDSICFVDVHSSQAVFDQRGKYPLRGINARVVDLQKVTRFVAQGQSAWNAMQMAQFNVALGDFAVNEGKLMDRIWISHNKICQWKK